MADLCMNAEPIEVCTNNVYTDTYDEKTEIWENCDKTEVRVNDDNAECTNNAKIELCINAVSFVSDKKIEKKTEKNIEQKARIATILNFTTGSWRNVLINKNGKIEV